MIFIRRLFYYIVTILFCQEGNAMKKILSLALSAIMITSFAGCGSKPAESSEALATEAQTTQAETIAPDVKDKLDKALSDAKYNGIV